MAAGGSSHCAHRLPDTSASDLTLPPAVTQAFHNTTETRSKVITHSASLVRLSRTSPRGSSPPASSPPASSRGHAGHLLGHGLRTAPPTPRHFPLAADQTRPPAVWFCGAWQAGRGPAPRRPHRGVHVQEVACGVHTVRAHSPAPRPRPFRPGPRRPVPREPGHVLHSRPRRLGLGMAKARLASAWKPGCVLGRGLCTHMYLLEKQRGQVPPLGSPSAVRGGHEQNWSDSANFCISRKLETSRNGQVLRTLGDSLTSVEPPRKLWAKFK